MAVRARRNVIALDRYRQDRQRREECDTVLWNLLKRHGKDVIATWPTCRTCQLPMDPAAVANSNGEPFKDHPGCSIDSIKPERKAA